MGKITKPSPSHGTETRHFSFLFTMTNFSKFMHKRMFLSCLLLMLHRSLRLLWKRSGSSKSGLECERKNESRWPRKIQFTSRHHTAHCLNYRSASHNKGVVNTVCPHAGTFSRPHSASDGQIICNYAFPHKEDALILWWWWYRLESTLYCCRMMPFVHAHNIAHTGLSRTASWKFKALKIKFKKKKS